MQHFGDSWHLDILGTMGRPRLAVQVRRVLSQLLIDQTPNGQKITA